MAGVTLLSVSIYLVMSLGFNDLSDRTAKSTLTMLSESVFQTLRLSMFTGDRATIADTLDRASQIEGVAHLSIAPSQEVIETFDLPITFSTDRDILRVFETQEATWLERKEAGVPHVRLLRPLVAESVCLQCHVLNQEGDVLGVMDLVISLEENERLIVGAQTRFTLFILLALVVFVVIAALFIARFNRDLHAIRSGLLDFFAFLGQKKERPERLAVSSKDEFGQMAGVINDNIERIEEGLKRDRLFIKEATQIVTKVSQGQLAPRLQSIANTPALNELRSVINKMIEGLDQNVRSILNVLEAFGEDNYTAMADAEGLEGELRELLEGVNRLGDSISGMLCASLKNGQILEGSSQELGGYVHTLSDATSDQVQALEETVGAVEKIAETIRHTTQKALRMSRIAEETQQSAQSGNQLANSTMDAMEEIVKSANAINEAIGVIDTIAFQTNILSLNAAVEAATAGEAGKGFAVVAQEVRNLAGRSAEAAKRIKELVGEAQQRAEEGKEISVHMMEGFNALSGKIEETSSLVGDVTQQSHHQMEEIEHINAIVATIGHKTQESAKVAAQTREIAARTAQMAKRLVEETRGKRFNADAPECRLLEERSRDVDDR